MHSGMLRFIVTLALAVADECPSDPNECGCADRAYTDYRGTLDRTANGNLCQKWSEQTPQKHGFFKPEDMPDEQLDENYCRNPLGYEEKAWCYIIDSKVRWEYCDVPTCGDTTTTTTTYDTKPCDNLTDECACMEDRGRSYRGTVAKTILGFDCLPWASQDPIYHTDHRPGHPNQAQEDLKENYCRNPHNEERGPWCYVDNTTNGFVKHWDYCDVEWCTQTTTTSCENMDPDNCGCRKDYARGYRGKLAKTKKGLTCQRWDQQLPHSHDFRPKAPWAKDEGLEENYCRNPFGEDHSDGPWCYTESESLRFDYCDVDWCD